MNATDYLTALANGDTPLASRDKGIIHVGANTGQECTRYADANLDILWIEAHPESFRQLATNIHSYPKQTAICQLITDEDDIPTAFHVTSNNAESSSILELGLHLEMHPDIVCTETITLNSLTLDTLLARKKIDISVYDTLLVDVQGAELFILRGASTTLAQVGFVVVEASDFEVYRGCGSLDEIDAFLVKHNFRRLLLNNFGCKCGNLFVMGYQRSVEQHTRSPT